jgi:hypothetical protein
LACGGRTNYAADNGEIKLENVISIEYFKAEDSLRKQANFVLFDEGSVKQIVKEINESYSPNEMESKGWDKIVVTTKTKKLVFLTNGEVIGLKEKGLFYYLTERYFNWNTKK